MTRIPPFATVFAQLALVAFGWLGAPAGAHAQGPITTGSPTTSLREIKVPPDSMLRNQRVLINGTPCDVLAFSPDGRHLAASSHLSPVIKIWDVATSNLVAEIPTGGLMHKGHHHRVAYSPDGKYLLYSGATLRGARDNASLLILSSKTYSLETAIEGPRAPPSGTYRGPPVATRRLVQAFAISPDSQTVVATYGGRPMDYESPVLYAVSSGQKLKAVAISEDSEAIAFSPDNRYFAEGIYVPDRERGGPGHGNIRIWDSRTMEVVRTIKRAHVGRVWAIAFSPDGKQLISTGDGPALSAYRDKVTGKIIEVPMKYDPARIWDVATGILVKELSARDRQDFRYRSAYYTHEGLRVVIQAGYNGLHFFDLRSQTPTEIVEFENRRFATGMALSRDGRRVALSVGERIMLWDIRH